MLGGKASRIESPAVTTIRAPESVSMLAMAAGSRR